VPAEESDGDDEEDLGLVEDPLADGIYLEDQQDNEEDYQGAAENIVCDILGDETDSPKGNGASRSAKMMMQ
jgi:hypothetical protein